MIAGGIGIAFGIVHPSSADVRTYGLIVAVIVVGLYAPLMLTYFNGQTLGKRVLGIRVVNSDGTPIGLGRALMREPLMKTLVLGAVPLAALVDALWPLADRENRAIHDLICATHVVGAKN